VFSSFHDELCWIILIHYFYYVFLCLSMKLFLLYRWGGGEGGGGGRGCERKETCTTPDKLFPFSIRVLSSFQFAISIFLGLKFPTPLRLFATSSNWYIPSCNYRPNILLYLTRCSDGNKLFWFIYYLIGIYAQIMIHTLIESNWKSRVHLCWRKQVGFSSPASATFRVYLYQRKHRILNINK